MIYSPTKGNRIPHPKGVNILLIKNPCMCCGHNMVDVVDPRKRIFTWLARIQLTMAHTMIDGHADHDPTSPQM